MKFLPLSSAYHERRVLVTGHTGFKGSWLSWWLHLMGANVTGFALPPKYRQGPFLKARMADVITHIEGDVRDAAAVDRVVRRVKPEFVFHLAAQPLVRESYEKPEETFHVNVMGTVHVLDAIRKAGAPCSVVIITSDKCYENREWMYSYRENDAMGGHDPYSASKGCAELVTSSFARSFFGVASRIHVASARAGNVIGPGDWSRDRIVPDAVMALKAGRVLDVRNPDAVRPWQHVLDPVAGYLRLGERLCRRGKTFAEAWNFGPSPESAQTVSALADAMISAWGAGQWRARRKRGAAHEAGYLRLGIDKAVARLGWEPTWSFERTVEETVCGYQALLAARGPRAAREMLSGEIFDYVDDACALGHEWTRSR